MLRRRAHMGSHVWKACHVCACVLFVLTCACFCAVCRFSACLCVARLCLPLLACIFLCVCFHVSIGVHCVALLPPPRGRPRMWRSTEGDTHVHQWPLTTICLKLRGPGLNLDIFGRPGPLFDQLGPASATVACPKGRSRRHSGRRRLTGAAPASRRRGQPRRGTA